MRKRRHELTYICMVETGTSASGKTKTWNARTKAQSAKNPRGEGGMHLGEVMWYGPWRKYIFYADMSTLYEQKCLREIADFIEEQTREHMAERRASRKKARTPKP